GLDDAVLQAAGAHHDAGHARIARKEGGVGIRTQRRICGLHLRRGKRQEGGNRGQKGPETLHPTHSLVLQRGGAIYLRTALRTQTAIVAATAPNPLTSREKPQLQGEFWAV